MSKDIKWTIPIVRKTYSHQNQYSQVPTTRCLISSPATSVKPVTCKCSVIPRMPKRVFIQGRHGHASSRLINPKCSRAACQPNGPSSGFNLISKHYDDLTVCFVSWRVRGGCKSNVTGLVWCVYTGLALRRDMSNHADVDCRPPSFRLKRLV